MTSISFPTDTHFFFDYDSQGRLARQQQDGGAGQLTFTYDVTSYRVKDARATSPTSSSTTPAIRRRPSMAWDENVRDCLHGQLSHAGHRGRRHFLQPRSTTIAATSCRFSIRWANEQQFDYESTLQ